MKKVEISVRPEKVRDVCEALHDMGLYGIVLSESRFIDNNIESDFEKMDDKTFISPKVELVLTVPNSLVEPIIFTVISAARVGDPADGKIIVSSVEKVVQMDDYEINESMLQWY